MFERLQCVTIFNIFIAARQSSKLYRVPNMLFQKEKKESSNFMQIQFKKVNTCSIYDTKREHWKYKSEKKVTFFRGLVSQCASSVWIESREKGNGCSNNNKPSITWCS